MIEKLEPNEKILLTIDEAAEYCSIGHHRLREIIEENPDYDFILLKGKQKLIKRPLFEKWLESVMFI